MPLVEITVPAGHLPQAAFETVQREVAASVLARMALPGDEFFAAATWVYVREAEKGSAATGAGGEPGILVVVTALERFLTPERNESLSADLVRTFRNAAPAADGAEPPVWLIVHQIAEGDWTVNGVRTRRAKIDELVAASEHRSAEHRSAEDRPTQNR